MKSIEGTEVSPDMQPGHSRISRALVVAVALMLVAASWYSPIQQLANSQVDAGLKRALISFASARTLNALISVLQGTELGLQPAGVGVTLTPGQVLDPVNQMIEQFSTLMLVASVSFGIQKALLAIGAHWVISLLVSVLAVSWAALHLWRSRSPAWLSRLFVILLLVRFAVPVVTLGSDLIYERFLKNDFNAQQLALDRAAGELQRVTPKELGPSPTAGAEAGWWEELKKKAEAIKANLHINFDSIKQTVQQLPEKLISMTVIFVLQTVLIPVFLLWALYRGLFGVLQLPRR